MNIRLKHPIWTVSVLTPLMAASLIFSGCQPTPENEVISLKEDVNEVVDAYRFLAYKNESGCTLSLLCFPGNGQELVELPYVSTGTEVTAEDFETTRQKYLSQNCCKYTGDEAAGLALDFLEAAGIDTSNLLVSDISVLAKRSTSDSTLYEGIWGYCVHLSHGVGSVPQTLAGNTIIYEPETENSSGKNTGKVPYSYETLKLYVTNEGVQKLEWNNPMVMGDVLTDRVSLKPFNEILEIICEHIGYAYEGLLMGEKPDSQVEIGKITFGLMRIQNPDDENQFTLIPVWDVFQKNTDTGLVEDVSLITINAMDGSIIDRGAGY